MTDSQKDILASHDFHGRFERDLAALMRVRPTIRDSAVRDVANVTAGDMVAELVKENPRGILRQEEMFRHLRNDLLAIAKNLGVLRSGFDLGKMS